MKPLLIVVALSMLLASCATPRTGVVRRSDADYYYTDWRTIPSRKAFDVAAAPEGGMTAFIARFNYPATLRRQRVGGTVLALVSLDSTGRVLDAHIVRSVHPVLDRMVVEAILRTKWSPALKHNVPIPLKFYLPVSFNPP